MFWILKQKKIEVLNPERAGDAEFTYKCGAEEFILHLIAVKNKMTYKSPLKRSVEILLCTEGQGSITDLIDKNPINISRGISLIIPAETGQYRIQGNAVIYKVSVPI